MEFSVSGCGALGEYPLHNIADGNPKHLGGGWACNKNHGTAGEHWFVVDLQKSYDLKKIELCHQGTVGDSRYNTTAFTLSVSTDNVAYETVQTVTGNTANKTEVTFDAVKSVRYVKVEITDPNANADNTARMGEVCLYGENGAAIRIKPFNETLNITDGTLTTDLLLDTTPVSFYNWVSATENVMITQITSTGTEPLALSSKLFIRTDHADMYPLDAGVNSDGSIWVSKASSNSRENTDENSWKSKVVLMSKLLGAQATAAKNADGSSAELAFTLPAGGTVYLVTAIGGGGQNYDWQGKLQGQEPSAEAAAILSGFNDSDDIDALKVENDNWWKEYWLKSYIDIGDEQIHRYYYGSLYYMACTAREDTLPSGLYGVWATTDNGRWSSDYHLNYNMIAPFFGVYSSNRAELARSLKDPLLDFMEVGKYKAKNELTHLCANYINGGALPTAATYKTTEFKGREDLKNGIDDAVLYPVGIGPWGSVADGNYWGQVFNAAFSATALTAYYDYTKDADYFKEIYPFLLANANFYEAWCEKEVFEDGTYRYNIWSGAHEKTFDLNANTAIGAVKNLLECLIHGVEDGVLLIGTDVTQEKYDTWVDMYENMTPYATQDGFYEQGLSYANPVFVLSEDGVKLWKGSANVDLEFIVPSHQLGFDSDPVLLQTARNSIELKEIANGDIWNQRNNTPKLYAMVTLVGVPANYVMQKFKALLDSSMLENYTLNDGAHGIEKAGAIEFINAMLLQSDNGIIKAFPNWTGNDASFKRLRTEGAFVVSSAMKNGKVTGIEITGEVGGNATVVSPWGNIKVLDSKGNPVSFVRGMTKNTGEETVTFEAVKGETYTLVEETERAVTGVELNCASLRLDVDGAACLVATVLPADAENKAVIWTSSNTDAVTVDQNGNLTACGIGASTVTAKTVSGGFSASCRVTVGESMISVSKQPVTKGETFNLTELGSVDWMAPMLNSTQWAEVQYYRKDIESPIIQATGGYRHRYVETEADLSLTWTDGNESMPTYNGTAAASFTRYQDAFYEWRVPVEAYHQTLNMIVGTNGGVCYLQAYFKSNPDDVYQLTCACNEDNSAIHKNKGHIMASIDFVGSPDDELVIRYEIDGFVPGTQSESNAQLIVIALALEKHNLSDYEYLEGEEKHTRACTDDGCDYTVEEACTKTGICTTHCAVCEHVFSTEPGHTFPHACSESCSVCGDENSDAVPHEDDNTDHACDVCGTSVGEHADGDDKDHVCDHCGQSVGEACYDEIKDHKCDECGTETNMELHVDGDDN
ncbi:MAG: discoidin domain-containing protein, partial [Clostridia bacterium]|nr:discoidin domain-containing protein [Clostridia bacterium]